MTSLKESESEEKWLIALVPLCITNAPGTIPSTIRIARGERFQLDGDEAIDVEQLYRVKAIAVYTGSEKQEALRSDALEQVAKDKANPFKRKKRERARARGANG